MRKLLFTCRRDATPALLPPDECSMLPALGRGGACLVNRHRGRAGADWRWPATLPCHMRRRIRASYVRRRIHACNDSGRSHTPTALSVRCRGLRMLAERSTPMALPSHTKTTCSRSRSINSALSNAGNTTTPSRRQRATARCNAPGS